MRSFISLVAAAMSLVSVASAAQFNVEVGKDNQNVFAPTSVSGVQAGDTITFRFTSKSHSVTQSTFDKPCEAKAGGVDSGFQTVGTDGRFPEWTIKIENVTTPHWFYCARSPHCTASGMVFAINPTAARTFETFQNIAKGLAAPPANSTTPAPGTNGTSSANTPAATDNSTTSGTNGTSNASNAPPPGSGAFALSAPHMSATVLLAALSLIAGLAI